MQTRNDVTIAVNQDDIDRGLPNSSSSCPVALAIYRTLQLSACVGRQTAKIGGLGRYFLPDHATQFIHRFDNELAVSPITFTMQYQDEEE